MKKYTNKIVAGAVLLLVVYGGYRLSLSSRAPVQSSPASLTQLWSLGGFDIPEQAYYDSGSGTVFVSNLPAGPTDKSGKGWIAQISLDGKMLNKSFITGLNSPKGMKVYNNTLWIADPDEIVGVPLPVTDGLKSAKRFQIAGAGCLNSLDFDEAGTAIYSADTCTDTIFKTDVATGKSTVFMAGPQLQSPNGILIRGGILYLTSSDLDVDGKMNFQDSAKMGMLYAIDLSTKTMRAITKTSPGMLDGLDITPEGNFLISSYNTSRIFQVTPDGVPTLLYEEPNASFSDLTFVPSKQMLLAPAQAKNEVRAFLYVPVK